MALLSGIVISAVAAWGLFLPLYSTQNIETGLHDTYYVMATQHYLLSLGMLLVLFALPLLIIARYLPRPVWLGPVVLLLLHFGAGFTMFPQHLLAGNFPRRFVDAEPYFTTMNFAASVCAVMVQVAFAVMTLATLVALYRMGRARWMQ